MARSLAELLKASLGVDTIDEIETVSVGTTAQKILKNDPQRMGMIFYNLSANSIYLLPREDVSSSKGFALIGNGSGTSFNWEHDGIFLSRNWYAIASAAASTLFIAQVRINPLSEDKAKV